MIFFNLDFSWALTRGNAFGICVCLIFLSTLFNHAIRWHAERICKKMYPSKKHKEIFPYFKNNQIKKRLLLGFNGVVSKFNIIFSFIETIILSITIIITTLYLIFYIKVMSDILRVIVLIDLIIHGLDALSLLGTYRVL